MSANAFKIVTVFSSKTLSDAHFTSTFNFLLADKDSNMAVVEASPDRVRDRRPENGDNFMVCTNHFVHSEMQDLEDQKARHGSNWDTLPRYTTIYNVLRQHDGRIDLKIAQEVLSNTADTYALTKEKSSSARSGRS